MPDGAQPRGLALERPFHRVDGHQFVSFIKDAALTGPCDEPVFLTRSGLRLLENGAPLAAPHSEHGDISMRGHGRYSHWDDGVRFSSSDGADPNSNRRTYSVIVTPQKPIVLALGSCYLREAVEELEQRGAILRSLPTKGTLNTTGEVRQLLKACLEEEETAPSLCETPQNFPLNLRRRFVEEACALVIEVGAPLMFELGRWQVNPARIVSELVEPAQAQGEEIGRAAYRWYHLGLLRQDEDVRRAESARFLELWNGHAPDWVREAITGIRVRSQTLASLAWELDSIRTVARKPVLVTSTTMGYTSRGKPFSFTPNFFNKLSERCADYGLPVVHPHVIVEKMGIDRALQEDRWHFTDEGRAAYADLIWENLSVLAR